MTMTKGNKKFDYPLNSGDREGRIHGRNNDLKLHEADQVKEDGLDKDRGFLIGGDRCGVRPDLEAQVSPHQHQLNLR